MANSQSSVSIDPREFTIRRLHSLSGLVPIGMYLIVHLVVNSTVVDSPAAFQRNVYQIHSLGTLLPAVEWAFIFLPILFHAVVGIFIIRGGVPNTGAYPFAANIRYTLQRSSGIIAMLFIAWHVFHVHGWFHNSWWLERVAQPLGGAQFRPFNAASTAAEAITASPVVTAIYAVGVLACVFHLFDGLWAFGITWGIWISPTAQRRAVWVCGAAGAALACVGMAALWGLSNVAVDRAAEMERTMYRARVESGAVDPNPHKVSLPPANEHK